MDFVGERMEERVVAVAVDMGWGKGMEALHAAVASAYEVVAGRKSLMSLG